MNFSLFPCECEVKKTGNKEKEKFWMELRGLTAFENKKIWKNLIIALWHL